MPRITKVYTRSGDDGTTSLGSGQRVAKDSLRIEAYGTVDELNSQIGVVLAAGVARDLTTALSGIQNDLFHLGSDLCVPEDQKTATPVPAIEPRHVGDLEKLIDRLTSELPPLENFVLPGGSPAGAALHVARTICRRAERRLVALAREERIGAHTIEYVNRLSDALFVMAREENRRRGVPDVLWESRK
jgi:cob(I)alamin adenosyltransferase